MITVNVGEETNIPVTLMHGRRKEVNLALMGLEEVYRVTGELRS